MTYVSTPYPVYVRAQNEKNPKPTP